jgi:hypothetical protein
MALAEMLLNFQDSPGFVGCLELLARGDIESAFAELEVGKLLSMVGVKFSFNPRTLGTKADYDLIVVFRNGEKGFAETKCAAERGPFRESRVLNPLRKARSQLPDDGPVVIFMKIPEEWATREEFGEKMNAAIKRFFRGTGAVVAVELFATGFRFNWTVAAPAVAGVEIINGHHRFDTTKDWSLIGPIPPNTPSVPPSWWKSIPALIDPSVDPRLIRP